MTKKAASNVNASEPRYATVAPRRFSSIIFSHCFAGPIRNIIEPIDSMFPSVNVVASLTGRRMKSCDARDKSMPMEKQTPNPSSLCVLV